MKKDILIVGVIIALSIICIFGGIYLERRSEIPFGGYEFSVFRESNNTPFEAILDFQLYYDFEEEIGNISFRAIDKNIDRVEIKLPGWCSPIM